MKKALPVCFLLIALAGLPQLSEKKTTRLPIIDVHQHSLPMRFLPDGSPPPILCPNDIEPCSNPPSRYQTDEEILRGTLEYMQKYNIVRSIVTAIPGEVLDFWLKSAPDRFVGGPACDLLEHLKPIDEIKKEFLSGKYGLLGEMAMQYSSVRPDDEILDPYYALAEELDIPVLTHTLGIGDRRPDFRSAMGDPLILEEVLKRHPKLRIYVENAGYPFSDRMIALLYQYPQVYADLSTITWVIPRTAFHDYLKRLVRAGFSDRLMFGSDQMIWPETIGMAVEAIESAYFLSDQQKRDIFFNNAVRFFKWDEEELLKMSWDKTVDANAAVEPLGATILTEGNPGKVGMSEDVLNNAVGLFKKAVDYGDISGAVLLVARSGKIVIHEAVGWRDIENRVSMTVDSLFNIASITKSITSAGVLILVDEGKLELEAPISRYIPEFAEGKKGKIQVKHLLNHTSGFRFQDFGDPLNPEKLKGSESLQSEVLSFASTDPSGTPGAYYYYSNRGYCILSALIEIASGKRLDAFIKNVLLDPIEMKDTFFPAPDFSSGRLAKGYEINEGQLKETATVWTPFPAGYGFMASTALDLAKFCQLFLNGGSYGTAKILSSETIKKATRAIVRTPFLYRSPEAHKALGRRPIPRWYYTRDSRGLGIINGYGYGWAVSEEGTFEHAGASGTFIWIDPNTEVIAVILTQCPNARIPGNEFLDFVKASVRKET